MLLVQIVRIPDEGIEAFRLFESRVLPLVPQYGRTLERRLRTSDGRTEVHTVSFPSHEALAAYLADPGRQNDLHLLHESGAKPELLEVTDVTEETVSS